MIKNSLNAQIVDALKAKDELRLSTLRMLLSALNYDVIAKQHELSEDEEIAVVKREAKKRIDAIEAYEKAGASDRADKEKQELAILKEYLPDMLSDEEVSKLVEESIKESGASVISDMGKVIRLVMAKAKNRADGSKVAALVKGKLQ